MTKAMAAMLVFLKKEKVIKILLYGDTNMAAMTSSAETLYVLAESCLFCILNTQKINNFFVLGNLTRS